MADAERLAAAAIDGAMKDGRLALQVIKKIDPAAGVASRCPCRYP